MESSDDSDSLTVVSRIGMYRQPASFSFKETARYSKFKKSAHIVQELDIASETNVNSSSRTKNRNKKHKKSKSRNRNSTMSIDSTLEKTLMPEPEAILAESKPKVIKTTTATTSTIVTTTAAATAVAELEKSSKKRQKHRDNDMNKTIAYNYCVPTKGSSNLKHKSKRINTNDDNAYETTRTYILQHLNPPQKDSFDEMINSIHDCNRMIFLACSNYRNVEDLQKMEWSEAVLLQLSSLHTPVDFSLNSWSTILKFIDLNQWSVELNYNLRYYIGDLVMIHQIITNNHKYKMKYHKLRPDSMFVRIPTIDYSLLKTYTLNNSDYKSLKKLKSFPIRIRLKK